MSRYVISLTIVLTGLWLLLSGKWTHPVLLPLGAASVVLTVVLAYRLRILDEDGDPLRLAIPSLKYWPWLLVQMLRSNLQVARCILAGRDSISPRIAWIENSQTSDVGRAIMANSITLTPGTVTLQVRNDGILYYALTEAMQAEIDAGEMDRRVSRFEGEL